MTAVLNMLQYSLCGPLARLIVPIAVPALDQTCLCRTACDALNSHETERVNAEGGRTADSEPASDQMLENSRDEEVKLS